MRIRTSTLALWAILGLGVNAKAQNVGIGVAAPLERLHVAGGIRANSLAGVNSRLVMSDANGTLTNLAAGTANYVLTQGAAAPQWADPNGIFWRVGGNTLTAVGNLGTVSNHYLPIVTANVERMRVLANGQVVVASTAPFAGDIFSSYATGGNYAVNGYAVDGYGVYGEAAGNGTGVYAIAAGSGDGATGITAGTGAGVFGAEVSGAAFAGVMGWSLTGANVGVYGISDDYRAVFGEAITGTGIYGLATTGIGVYGQNAGTNANAAVRGANTNANGTGIVGVGNNAGAVTLGTGSGASFAGGGFGSLNFGRTVASGTGVYGAGNGVITVYSLAGGSGGSFAGTGTGSYHIATTAASGNGIVSLGNNSGTITTLLTGSGATGIGFNTGVFGYATAGAAANSEGGYFATAGGTGFARVGARNAGTNYKILGAGTVSTITPSADGNRDVIWFCPESPEVLFQDYGHSQLVNGTAVVQLDPTFSRNIFVSDDQPLRVFIQLEGDCQGVYVTNKTATSFEVRELGNGTSNVAFSYTVVGNRANETRNGVSSRYQDLRFPDAPAPREFNETAVESTPAQETEIREEAAPARREMNLPTPRLQNR